LFGILLFALGYWFAGKSRNYDLEDTWKITRDSLEYVILRNQETIDSLGDIISSRESIVDSLKQTRQIIIKTREIEKENVKKLPVTEAVEYLKTKLREYEEE
jgi:hypothetical protein